MASTSFNNNNEGLSTTRPLLFNGTNNSYWKNKMKIWIRAQDMKVWKVVEQGDHIPMKKSTTKVGETSKVIEIPKDESEFDDDDLKKDFAQQQGHQFYSLCTQ
ncbi:hypothetical protein PIB30_111561 [Stylosanthes scabra]|uniref:DUF4219 domain-containing protein n=1 Tax=Stylosanthes scabra TaxID=79078 RepID=A0ABU6T0M3_9FABA|nr:hypothetical protein [Stylosanthes scabra]